MESKITFKKIFIHLKTITKHKIFVTKLCFRAGIYKQGILHDLSKLHPVELLNGFKYADGNRSPIDNEKKIKGYSTSWLHHFHNNKHHYEYWYDATKKEFITMPYNYIVESFCDRIAAARVYLKENYHCGAALDYLLKHDTPDTMGEENYYMLKDLLEIESKCGIDFTLLFIKLNLKEKMNAKN